MATTEDDVLVLAKEHVLQGCNKYEGLLSSTSSLDVLINDVYMRCRPNAQDYDNRRDLISIFNAIARETSSHHNPVAVGFGSFIMDMFDDESDLDLSILFGKSKYGKQYKVKTEYLQKIADKLYDLQEKGHVTNIQPIFTARVPVLKVTDSGTGIECDISVRNVDGIAKSHLLQMISAIDERFQKLCVLMKAWAKAHHLNSSKDGTLGSTSLVLLVAFHLQTRDPPILPPLHEICKGGVNLEAVKKIIPSFLDYGKENKESLAELFVSLLIVLESVEALWPKGLCASTYKGSWACKPWKAVQGYMNIEDIIDKSQNTARAVKSEKKMNKIYSHIRNSLQQIESYISGDIDEAMLKNRLFGPDPPPKENKSINAHHPFLQKPPVGKPTKKKKRKRRSKKPDESSLRPPTSSLQTAAERDRSWETHGAINDHPLPGFNPLCQGPTGFRLGFYPHGQGPTGVRPEFHPHGQGFTGVRPEFYPPSQGPTGVRPEFRPLGHGSTGCRPEFRPHGQAPLGVSPEFHPYNQAPTRIRPEFRPLGHDLTGVRPNFHPLSQGPTGVRPETWRCGGDSMFSFSAPYTQHPPYVPVPPPMPYAPPVGFGSSYGPRQPLIPDNSSPFPRGFHAPDYRHFGAPMPYASSSKNVFHHHLEPEPNHHQNPRAADGSQTHYYF